MSVSFGSPSVLDAVGTGFTYQFGEPQDITLNPPRSAVGAGFTRDLC